MKEVDQFAKKIMLVFNCPRCGKEIKYVVEKLPKENFSADNYSGSVNSEIEEFDCFSCRKEHFTLLLTSGQGDKSLEISNKGSKYPINEEDVEIIVLESE